ncbi:hypothetical protein EJ03DRAFT_71021 [Teratosphaeria nubilosa]|uniref:Uncharacterized protein n=1 Tax=Teratosphaeria nubilosa TaxID=161662 RepID=A0A6G1LLQ9_9PEZI|nr:hypothetical protein EJ03DRAFT_71021 [Teratosphaeria nubilosa]
MKCRGTHRSPSPTRRRQWWSAVSAESNAGMCLVFARTATEPCSKKADPERACDSLLFFFSALRDARIVVNQARCTLRP